MSIAMVVSLYTSRMVLDALGVQDFGVYNVVGAVVIVFGFLNHGMTASTQRFLAFEIGKGDVSYLRKVFGLSVLVHVLLAILIFVIAETIGVWMLNEFLVIPEDRIQAANWVYQFSLWSFILSVLSVPFIAAIVSNEKMKVFSLVGILETFLKLISVLCLFSFSSNRLTYYAVLLFSVSIVTSLIYVIYSMRNFGESRDFELIWDKPLFHKMGVFAGWNLLGVSAGLAGNHGVNVLLNIFFGPLINAARGIAFQVQGAVNSFVTNFQVALNPAITKSYANNQYGSSFSMVFSGAKFSFFLLFIVSLPLYLQMETVLAWWLKTVPDYAVTFTRLVLVEILIGTVSGPLQALAQASGTIRRYQIAVSGVLLLNLPTSYLFLRFGCGPETTLFIAIFYACVALVVRLWVLKGIVGFPIWRFIREVIVRVIFIAAFGFVPAFLVCRYFHDTGSGFFLTLVVSIVSVTSAIFLWGLNHNEKAFLMKSINGLCKRVNA